MVYPAIVVCVALLAVIAVWTILTAQRLNRLHIRTDSALQNLGSALDYRAKLVAALLDEVCPDATAKARQAEGIPVRHGVLARRAAAERELTAVLERSRGIVPAAAAPAIAEATGRVEMAMRFYNDAVRATRALRLRPSVRLLRLEGTAKLPRYFEEMHRPEEPPAAGNS